MNDKIFTEENSLYQFDFSKADWATDRLHNIFHENNQIWCDVDFVVEYLSGDRNVNIKLLFVEYKNSNISNAQRPNSFQPDSDKKINNVVRKFTDSLCYMLSTGHNRKNYYVYLVEYPHSDSTTRRLLRNKIASRLPFEFQKQPQFLSQLIEKFDVLSIDEWNSHPEYSKFPIVPVTT